MSAKAAKTKKRPGPKPELFSLYPLNFDEAVDILVKAKPKKQDKDMTEENDNATKPQS
jgi:hypothetical protein